MRYPQHQFRDYLLWVALITLRVVVIVAVLSWVFSGFWFPHFTLNDSSQPSSGQIVVQLQPCPDNAVSVGRMGDQEAGSYTAKGNSGNWYYKTSSKHWAISQSWPGSAYVCKFPPKSGRS